MGVKIVDIEGIGPVKLVKRAGSRTIRVVITSRSEVRVTMPNIVPYAAGIAFAQSKRAWIVQHLRPVQLLTDGRKVGKQHHIQFVRTTGKKVSTRVTSEAAVIGLPNSVDPTSLAAQDAARAVALRALHVEAKAYLLPRIKVLADQHGFVYGNVSVKHMQSRWGSCTQQRDIALNCFLMELPLQLIDYVLVHELVHTRIMAHGKPFWDEVAKYVPRLSLIRKHMRRMKPDFQPDPHSLFPSNL